VHDGPGLRTVVFLKGCSVGCPWCQNPEGKSFAVQIAFDEAQCIGCGYCTGVCTRLARAQASADWRLECQGCGECTQVCPSAARRLVGRDYSVDQLVGLLLEDAEFYAGTGGGVTFSGGEPLEQAEFVFACAEAVGARGVHVALQTAGFWPERWRELIAARVQLVIFDLKHTDPSKMANALTGDSRAMLGNLRYLLEATMPVELRLTLIPGFNDGRADLDQIGRWLKAEGYEGELTLQPFHRLATAKRLIVGQAYRYSQVAPLSPEQLTTAAQALERWGFVAKMG